MVALLLQLLVLLLLRVEDHDDVDDLPLQLLLLLRDHDDAEEPDDLEDAIEGIWMNTRLLLTSVLSVVCAVLKVLCAQSSVDQDASVQVFKITTAPEDLLAMEES